MAVLDSRLTAAGYQVHRHGYPSNDTTIEAHVEGLRADLLTCCADAEALHLIGHSLGGLVIRATLLEPSSGEYPPGRVVLLAPPNQGSPLADILEDSEVGAAFLGPTGVRLGRDSDDIPASLGPPIRETGIIAGDRSINPIGSVLIPGPDDGAVAVEDTKIPGVPHLVVPRSHTLIMNSRVVSAAVIRFLATGPFDEKGGS